MIGRYLLFSDTSYNALGGFYDLMTISNDIDVVRNIIIENITEQNYQVVDLWRSRIIVKDFSYDEGIQLFDESDWRPLFDFISENKYYISEEDL